MLMNEELVHIEGISAVRLKNDKGDYHFYDHLTIRLSGPVRPEDDCGFLYFACAFRYGCNYGYREDDFLKLFKTPEEAWDFYMNFQQMLEGSVWRRDYTNNCIIDPDGIRFALTGEKLP